MLPSDNPIRRAADDVLGRDSLAASFGAQIRSVDPSQGLVVGVLGPWGSGKTSFSNLLRAHLERAGIPVLDFNPWMFSGTEQLLNSFFIELSAQLKMRPELAGVGERLEEYGEAFSGLVWIPIVGPWVERGRGVAKILGRFLKRRKEGLSGRREGVEAALRAREHPLVVVIDDIDRLGTDEIRDIFKLVRLTASFPNIIYVLAFDRLRVENALTEQGLPGRAYLEKIMQVVVDLPLIPDKVINKQIFEAIDAALDGLDIGDFDKALWPDVFVEVVKPLIGNVRDIRRYAAALRTTVASLKGEISVVDILALEAIRVFLPDVFAEMRTAVIPLTSTSEDHGRGGKNEAAELLVKRIVDAAGPSYESVVKASIHRLFPAADKYIGGTNYGGGWSDTWLRKRRVAHKDLLHYYFEMVIGEDLQSFFDAEHAFRLMPDEAAFDAFLRGLPEDRVQDVIASLEVFEEQFQPQHVVSGTSVLLNFLPFLPHRPRGMFDFGTRFTVTRVTYRLLRSLKAPDRVLEAVQEILPKLNSLSARLEVLDDVGYRANVGHKLVTAEAANKLEADWRDQVREASTDDLLAEPDLLQIMLRMVAAEEADDRPFVIPDDPRMTLAVLNAARSDTLRQSMGSRSVERLPRLGWSALVKVMGSEEVLIKRVRALFEDRHISVPADLKALLEKYLAGWRPDMVDDD